MKILKQNSKALQQIYDRRMVIRKKSIEEKVRHIIADIEQHGDDAVLKYTRRFDKAKLTARQMRVPESEISGAFQNITSDFVTDLKKIIHNVTDFYKAQKQRPAKINTDRRL